MKSSHLFRTREKSGNFHPPMEQRMQIDSKQFLNDGYAIIPECIPPDMLDQLRESFATLVERQKVIWAREAQPDEPPGGVWETSGQPARPKAASSAYPGTAATKRGNCSIPGFIFCAWR
jgi:hypothetical protein